MWFAKTLFRAEKKRENFVRFVLSIFYGGIIVCKTFCFGCDGIVLANTDFIESWCFNENSRWRVLANTTIKHSDPIPFGWNHSRYGKHRQITILTSRIVVGALFRISETLRLGCIFAGHDPQKNTFCDVITKIIQDITD
jgi:hypothetical protein